MSDDMIDPIHKLEETTVSVPNKLQEEEIYEEQQLNELLVPDIRQLPLNPPSAVESNYVSYFAPGPSPS